MRIRARISRDKKNGRGGGGGIGDADSCFDRLFVALKSGQDQQSGQGKSERTDHRQAAFGQPKMLMGAN